MTSKRFCLRSILMSLTPVPSVSSIPYFQLPLNQADLLNSTQQTAAGSQAMTAVGHGAQTVVQTTNGIADTVKGIYASANDLDNARKLLEQYILGTPVDTGAVQDDSSAVSSDATKVDTKTASMESFGMLSVLSPKTKLCRAAIHNFI